MEQLHEHAEAINKAATALGYVGFDLEHDMDGNIRYVQLSTDHVKALVFNITALTIQAFLHNKHIRGLLESPEVLKVGVGISGTSGSYQSLADQSNESIHSTGDALKIFRALDAGSRVHMRSLVELSYLAQMHDVNTFPSSLTVWERLARIREWFRQPVGVGHQVKLSDIVAHVLGEYLPKDNQLIDWSDPTQVGSDQILCMLRTHFHPPVHKTDTGRAALPDAAHDADAGRRLYGFFALNGTCSEAYPKDVKSLYSFDLGSDQTDTHHRLLVRGANPDVVWRAREIPTHGRRRKGILGIVILSGLYFALLVGARAYTTCIFLVSWVIASRIV